MARDRVSVGTIIRLAVACLVVGLILAALNVTPADLLTRVAGLVGGLWDAVQGVLGWAGSYMLLGALVVVPVWLARHLWRRMTRADD